MSGYANPAVQAFERRNAASTDFAGFEAEALPHLDDIFRAACSLMRNRTEAEDAVQETYLQAMKSFDRYTAGTNCRAWLFRILFHVIAHQRRKWYARFISAERENLEGTLVHTDSVPQTLTDEEILTALREIPQAYAEVVLLADVQEFSYREVQDTLGIPIGTVMSRLSRGRQLLRARLAECGTRAGIIKSR